MNKVCTKYDPTIIIELMKIMMLGLKNNTSVSTLAGEEKNIHLWRPDPRELNNTNLNIFSMLCIIQFVASLWNIQSRFLVAKLKQTLQFLLSRSLNLTSCVCFFFNKKEQLLQGNSLVFVQRKCEQMGNKDCSCNKVLFPFLSIVLIENLIYTSFTFLLLNWENVHW